MKTKKEAIAWAKSQQGKGIDYDGYYGLNDSPYKTL